MIVVCVVEFRSDIQTFVAEADHGCCCGAPAACSLIMPQDVYTTMISICVSA